MTTTRAQSLWQAWRRGADEAAFEDLVAGELAYAADLARRMGASAVEADDAVQEALVKLARERSDAPVRVGVRAWLCRRVTLAFKMHVRASGRRRAHERAAATPERAGAADAPRELRESVNHALARLAPDLRQAVVLRHLHDLDYRQMAHVLGVSRNACRLRVFKGLRALRDLLGADAAAMVAVIGVPAFAPTVAPAALAHAAATTAATTAAGSAAAAAGGKAIAAVAAAAAVTAGAVWIGRDAPPEAPAPPPVVAARPRPPPQPTPPPAPVPPPARPPAPVTPPALALLDAHLAGRAEADATLWDGAALDRLLGPAEGKTVRVTSVGPPIDLAALAAGAGRIELGPGRHVLAGGLRLRGRRGVLEIAGAGADATTLVLDRSTTVHVEGDLAGLRVRDLTVEGGTFLGVHGRAAAVFERVRFERWVDRAGFGAPVGSTGAALLAFRDCAFVGGVRRRAGGTVLAVRAAVLALFERCVVSDVARVVANGHPGDPHPRSLVHLRDCILEGAALTRRDDRAPGGYPMRVRGGSVAYGVARRPAAERWRRFGARRAEIDPATTLRPEPARVSLATLRTFLRGLPREEGGRLVAVEVLAHRGGGAPRFVTRRRRDGGGDAEQVHVWRLEDGRPRRLDAPTRELRRPLAFQPGRGTPLVELFEAAWPGLDPDEATGGVALHGRTDGSPVLVLLDRLLEAR